MDTDTITHISLCTGYGGIDLALKRVFGERLRTIAYSEIEGFAIANLVSKAQAGHLDDAPVWSDLRSFPWDEFHGLVGILSGGFPCQPFSSAGKRNADSDSRHIFPAILDGISRCRPRLVFLENVEGIISAKLAGDEWRDPAGTPVLLHVLRELERVGYCPTAGLFSASEVGAPHQRKRVFILAYCKGEGLERYDGLFAGCYKSRRDASEQERQTNWGNSGGKATAWPSRPGEPQHGWEPPRVVADASISRCNGRPDGISGRIWASGEASEDAAGCGGEGNGMRQTQSSMGLRSHGTESRLGLAELSGLSHQELAEICEWMVKTDNRTDELRLLGNGVVPATAERAFRALIQRFF